MKHRDIHHLRHKEHSHLSIGLFFIALGLALLIATNDLLHLGGITNYFTWETGMVFIGAILLLNLNFTGGFLCVAGGIWFLKDDIFIFPSQFFESFYWPSIIVLIGVSFILSSFFKKINIK
jgi:LiaF transmembrane domain